MSPNLPNLAAREGNGFFYFLNVPCMLTVWRCHHLVKLAIYSRDCHVSSSSSARGSSALVTNKVNWRDHLLATPRCSVSSTLEFFTLGGSLTDWEKKWWNAISWSTVLFYLNGFKKKVSKLSSSICVRRQPSDCCGANPVGKKVTNRRPGIYTQQVAKPIMKIEIIEMKIITIFMFIQCTVQSIIKVIIQWHFITKIPSHGTINK